jgi:catabolite regulation protein CreA
MQANILKKWQAKCLKMQDIIVSCSNVNQVEITQIKWKSNKVRKQDIYFSKDYLITWKRGLIQQLFGKMRVFFTNLYKMRVFFMIAVDFL